MSRNFWPSPHRKRILEALDPSVMESPCLLVPLPRSRTRTENPCRAQAIAADSPAFATIGIQHRASGRDVGSVRTESGADDQNAKPFAVPWGSDRLGVLNGNDIVVDSFALYWKAGWPRGWRVRGRRWRAAHRRRGRPRLVERGRGRIPLRRRICISVRLRQLVL